MEELSDVSDIEDENEDIVKYLYSGRIRIR